MWKQLVNKLNASRLVGVSMKFKTTGSILWRTKHKQKWLHFILGCLCYSVIIDLSTE